MIAWGVPELSVCRGEGLKRGILAVTAGTVVAALAVCAYVQVGYWRNSLTLFRHALAVTRGNYIAYYEIGLDLSSRGRLDAAIAHQRRALRLKPDFVYAHYEIGRALVKEGKPRQAIGHLRAALRIEPEFTEAHYYLGLASAALGDTRAAVLEYRKALRLDPEYKNAATELARILGGPGE